jgi:broad specificity phosphatase PhoE
MELIFVRHGLPVRIDGTADGTPADPGLSTRGGEQAHRVVSALALDEVTHLYTSPAQRARETAVPLQEALGLDLALRAAGDPRWDLLVKGELYHGDVDPDAFQRTVVTTVEQIAERHPGGRAVLFTHSGVINAWTAHLLDRPRVLWFAPAYASISRIGASRDGRRGVISLNETGHVRDLL